MVLHFLQLYPDLDVTDVLSPGNKSSLGWIAAPILLLALALITLLCGVWCRWLFRTGKRRYWGRVHNEHLRAAGGGGTTEEALEHRQERDSSEETDESLDDRKGLFSWNV